MTSTAKMKSSDDQPSFGVDTSGYYAESPDGEKVFLIETTLSGVKKVGIPWEDTCEASRKALTRLERLAVAMDLQRLAETMLDDLEQELGVTSDR